MPRPRSKSVSVWCSVGGCSECYYLLQRGINLIGRAWFALSASLRLSITCKVSMGGGCSLGPGIGTGSWIYGAYNSFLLCWKDWSGQPWFFVLVPSISTDTHIHRFSATDRRTERENREGKKICFSTSLLQSQELKEEKKRQFFSPIKSISNSTRGKATRKFWVILFILRNWAGIPCNITALRAD